MKTALTIAGFDPSSGAGITADLMVFAAHGLFGTSCITALTVQSTIEVATVHPISAEMVRITLNHLQPDLPPAGIKIGMLANAAIVRAVAEFLEEHREIPVVLDPIIRSSSGRELLSPEGVRVMRTRLLPLVDWITPNLEELSILTDQPVNNRKEIALAARFLQKSNPKLTVLATAGHLDPPDDLLLTATGDEYWLPGEHIATTSTHGTGCALSSAVVSRLIENDTPLAAAQNAKHYVTEALRTATPIGTGRGPVHHLWPLRRTEITG
jgi:hydroxymethylpyrimidine/phosphomethylpyrimidine kinase